MRTYRGLVVVLLALGMIAGCSNPGPDTARHPKPEGKYIPAIDAAAAMQGPDQRAQTLSDIASQSDLTEPQQLYLVSSIREMRQGEPVSNLQRTIRMTSADARRVLVTLLRNPVTTQRTKEFVGETLPSLNLSDDDQRAVTRAMM